MTAYRSSPRRAPLPFPKTPWWRLLRAWADGTLMRLLHHRLMHHREDVLRDLLMDRWRRGGQR